MPEGQGQGQRGSEGKDVSVTLLAGTGLASCFPAAPGTQPNKGRKPPGLKPAVLVTLLSRTVSPLFQNKTQKCQRKDRISSDPSTLDSKPGSRRSVVWVCEAAGGGRVPSSSWRGSPGAAAPRPPPPPAAGSPAPTALRRVGGPGVSPRASAGRAPSGCGTPPRRALLTQLRTARAP